jgi:hypothetical protein
LIDYQIAVLLFLNIARDDHIQTNFDAETIGSKPGCALWASIAKPVAKRVRKVTGLEGNKKTVGLLPCDRGVANAAYHGIYLMESATEQL